MKKSSVQRAGLFGWMPPGCPYGVAKEVFETKAFGQGSVRSKGVWAESIRSYIKPKKTGLVKYCLFCIERKNAFKWAFFSLKFSNSPIYICLSVLYTID